jgi:hypothetical protein
VPRSIISFGFEDGLEDGFDFDRDSEEDEGLDEENWLKRGVISIGPTSLKGPRGAVGFVREGFCIDVD